MSWTPEDMERMIAHAREQRAKIGVDQKPAPAAKTSRAKAPKMAVEDVDLSSLGLL